MEFPMIGTYWVGLPWPLAIPFFIGAVLIVLCILVIGLRLILPKSWLEQAGTARTADAPTVQGWVNPPDLGRYLDEINKTMEQHGFGKNPALRERAEAEIATAQAQASTPITDDWQYRKAYVAYRTILAARGKPEQICVIHHQTSLVDG